MGLRSIHYHLCGILCNRVLNSLQGFVIYHFVVMEIEQFVKLEHFVPVYKLYHVY